MGGAAGVAAQQLVRLRPGRYRLEVRYLGEQQASAPLQLRMACAELRGEGTLNKVLPIRSSGATTLSVDTPCRYAWISIEITDADPTAGFDASLDRLSLKRIG